MGFYYRKSVNLGPFRVNLSKSGLGYSVGGRGFRVGTTARGKKSQSHRLYIITAKPRWKNFARRSGFLGRLFIAT